MADKLYSRVHSRPPWQFALLLLSLAVALAIVAMGIFAATEESQSKGPSERGTVEGLKERLQKDLGRGDSNAYRVGDVYITTGALRINWTIDEKDNQIIANEAARDDLVRILESVKEENLRFSTLALDGDYVSENIYGNSERSRVLSVFYSASSVGRINFDEFETANIYEVADDVFFYNSALG